MHAKLLAVILKASTMFYLFAPVVSLKETYLLCWQMLISKKGVLLRQWKTNQIIKLKKRRITSKTRWLMPSKKINSRFTKLHSSSKWLPNTCLLYLWPCLFKNFKKYLEFSQKLMLKRNKVKHKSKNKSQRKPKSAEKGDNLI